MSAQVFVSIRFLQCFLYIDYTCEARPSKGVKINSFEKPLQGSEINKFDTQQIQLKKDKKNFAYLRRMLLYIQFIQLGTQLPGICQIICF